MTEGGARDTPEFKNQPEKWGEGMLSMNIYLTLLYNIDKILFVQVLV